jgi:succinyl-CoA synthetase beta subunit
MFVVTVCPGVVDAYKIWEMLQCQSLFVYKVLAAIAKELIDNSGMPILSAVEFQTADQVKAALS